MILRNQRMSAQIYRAKFSPGEVVEHKLFGYSGVIYDADPFFMGSDEWYDTVARSRPPKNRPWYRVLVDGQDGETYVAEKNLQRGDSKPIDHPLLDTYFSHYANGCYRLRQPPT